MPAVGMCLFRLAGGDRTWRPTLVVCSKYVKACSEATSGLQSAPFAPMPQPSRLPQNDPWARSGRPMRKCSAPCWVQQGFLGTRSKSVSRWRAPRTRRVSTRSSSNQQFSAVILASVRGMSCRALGAGPTSLVGQAIRGNIAYYRFSEVAVVVPGDTSNASDDFLSAGGRLNSRNPKVDSDPRSPARRAHKEIVS
jgi:hypothetical protein